MTDAYFNDLQMALSWNANRLENTKRLHTPPANQQNGAPHRNSFPSVKHRSAERLK